MPFIRSFLLVLILVVLVLLTLPFVMPCKAFFTNYHVGY